MQIARVSPEAPTWEATGWVLAHKLGDDPPRLERLLELAPREARPKLASGFGWGLTATLLEEHPDASTHGVERIAGLIECFLPSSRPDIYSGVERAFAPGTTPALDPGLLPILRERLGGVR